MEPIIFYNGKIYTLDPERPVAEALVAYGGKIVYVGEESKALAKWHGKRVDLGGGVVLPGIVDAHIHLESLSMGEEIVALEDCRSIDEIKEKLAVALKSREGSRWLVGRGWDQERLDEKRMPTRWDLDEVSKEIPILIVRVCGHVAVANSKALELLGISRDTRDPPGGVIGRDERGEPNGILWEEAAAKARESIPPPTTERLAKMLERKLGELNSYGITCVVSVSARPRLLKALTRLWVTGRLTARVRLFMEETAFPHMERLGLEGGIGDEMLKIIGVKVFMDGSLGGRSAALKSPYSDMPETSGVLLKDKNTIKTLLLRCTESRMMIAIHAIGDRAIEEALHGIKEAGHPELARIEHASLTPPETLDLMGEVKPRAVVVQPHFIVSDWWVEDRLGERARWTYMFKSMLKMGLSLAGSSDAPVEPPNPWLGIWAASCLRGEESLSCDDAIKIYTLGGWISVGEDGQGALVEGRYADFSVYTEDPLGLNCEELKRLRPFMTVVGGDIVYRADRASSPSR